MTRWWLVILIVFATSAVLSPAAMAVDGCPDGSGLCGAFCLFPFSGSTTASPFEMADSVVPATPSCPLAMALPPLDAPPKPLLLSA